MDESAGWTIVVAPARACIIDYAAFLSLAAVPASILTKALPRKRLMNASANLQILHELIAALENRLPQVERSGEAAIARDAAALKARALERIAEIERDMALASAAPALSPGLSTP